MVAYTPLISVIIPNYNRGELLRETLASLRGQSYQNWEAWVVDDGSEDNSAKIAHQLIDTDPRIHYIRRNREPRGAPVCRNIGIEASRGDFLIFLDSDDLLAPHAMLQRSQAILHHPDHDFWVFPILMFREKPEDGTMLWNIDNGEPDLHRFLILDAPWQTSGPVWRKSAVEKTGRFTEGLACWQDVDFHLKALIAGLKGLKCYDHPPDVWYRQHESGSISQGEISSPAKLKSRFDIFRNNTLALTAENRPPDPGFIMEDLRLLGGNIAIGAARTLQETICRQVITFGLSQGVFHPQHARQFTRILRFYQLRLNRIPFLDRRIRHITREYRQDSNIGRHPYQKPA